LETAIVVDLIKCGIEKRARWSGYVVVEIFDLQNRDDNEKWQDNETKKDV
jgi:hypothetical protein